MNYAIDVCALVCVWLTYVVLSVTILVVQHFQQFLLNQGLLVERSLVLYDLYGHPRPLLSIIGFHHLQREREREGGREGGNEGGREGEREGGKEGVRERGGGKEGVREGKNKVSMYDSDYVTVLHSQN